MRVFFLASMIVVLSGAPPATVATYQGFEETGLPTEATWIDLDSGTGASNWDYTSAPISGSESLQLPDSSSGASEVAFDFPADTDSNIYAAFKIKFSADTASATSDWVFFTSSVPADLARMRQNTTGQVQMVIDGTATGNLIDMAVGTVYRVKLRYDGGSGTEQMEVWIASEASGAWGSSLTSQNGTSTARASRIKFVVAATHNRDSFIDNVKVSTSDIAWSDLD